MNEDILYTPEELATKLKLSKYTIYEMIKRGDIKAHHIGRSIRVSESQLRLYIMSTGKSENIYDAVIISDGDEKIAVLDGSDQVQFCVSTEFEGKARVAIGPEDIILSKGTVLSSARNMLKGIVTDIVPEERSVRIILDVGVPLIALITKKSTEEMDIKVGDELYAIFKTMAVKVIK